MARIEYSSGSGSRFRGDRVSERYQVQGFFGCRCEPFREL